VKLIKILLFPLFVLGYLIGLLFAALKHGFMQAQRDVVDET
jgi:hypothetical protein